MKKFLNAALISVLALSMCLALTACGEKKISDAEGIAALSALQTGELVSPETYTTALKMESYALKEDGSSLYRNGSMEMKSIIQDLSTNMQVYAKIDSAEYAEDGTKDEYSVDLETWYLKQDGDYWAYARIGEDKYKNQQTLDLESILGNAPSFDTLFAEAFDASALEELAEDEDISELNYSFTKKGKVYTFKMSLKSASETGYEKVSFVIKFDDTMITHVETNASEFDSTGKEVAKMSLLITLELKGSVSLPSDHADYEVPTDA